MKKETYLLSILTFIYIMFFSGCVINSGNTSAEQQKPLESDTGNNYDSQNMKAEELIFWTFQELHKAFIDDAVDTWNTKNPDNRLKIDTSVFPYEEMHSKLYITLQSGGGSPDLVDIEINKFANFVKGNKVPFVPLNSILEKDLENFIQQRLENYAKDGKYYGLDYHVGATVMYYNKEILKRANVDVDSIETWDDYIEAGRKVVKATGKPMSTIEISDHWSYYPLLLQKGSDFLDKKGNVILDNKVNIDTLQFLKDMIYKYNIAIPAPGGSHHSEEYWVFMNKGGAASLLMPAWYMGRFIQYMPDLKGKIEVRLMPAWEKGSIRSVAMGGTATVVTAQSRKKDLALKFLAFAKATREGSLKTWTILGLDPIREDAWDGPEMDIPNRFTEYFGKDVVDIIKQTRDKLNITNMGEKYPACVSQVQKKVLFKCLKEKSQTPLEALRSARDEIEEKQTGW